MLLIILAWLRIVVIPAIFGKKGVRYEPKKVVYRVGSTIITKVEAEEVYDEEFELPDYKTAMEPVTENLVCRDWSIEPKLPKGMEIDSLTGAIKGRPKEMSEKTKYIVTTKVHNGIKKLRVSITVIEALEKDDIDEELVDEQEEVEEISSPDSTLEEVEESILEEEFEEVTDSSESDQETSDSEDFIEEEESFDDEIEEEDFEDEEEFEEEEDLEDDQEEYFEDDESRYGKEKTKKKREDTWRREFVNIGYTPPTREVEEEKPKVHSRYARKGVSDEVDEEETEYLDDNEYIENSEDIIDEDVIGRDHDEDWDDDVKEEEYLDQDSESEFNDEDEDWDDDSEIGDAEDELTIEEDMHGEPATDRAQAKSETSETRREAFKAVKSTEDADTESPQEKDQENKKPTKVRGIRIEDEVADESSRSTRPESETDTPSTTTSTKRRPSKTRGVRKEDTTNSATTPPKRRPTKVRGVREEDIASSTTTSSTKRRPTKVRGIKDDSTGTGRPSRERGVRDSETKPSAPRRRKERERGIKVDENSILNIGYKPKRRGEKKVLKRGERDRGIKIDSSSRLAIPKKSEEKKEDVPEQKGAGSERDRGIKLEKKSGMSVDYTKPEKKKKAPVKKGERDKGIKPGEKERGLPKKRERKGKF